MRRSIHSARMSAPEFPKAAADIVESVEQSEQCSSAAAGLAADRTMCRSMCRSMYRSAKYHSCSRLAHIGDTMEAQDDDGLAGWEVHSGGAQGVTDEQGTASVSSAVPAPEAQGAQEEELPGAGAAVPSEPFPPPPSAPPMAPAAGSPGAQEAPDRCARPRTTRLAHRRGVTPQPLLPASLSDFSPPQHARAGCCCGWRG
jgi:hypothetical protein